MLEILIFLCSELCKFVQNFWPMSEACEIAQPVDLKLWKVSPLFVKLVCYCVTVQTRNTSYRPLGSYLENQKLIILKRVTSPICLKPCWGLFPTNENHFPIFAHIRKLWKRALRDLLAWISRETNLFKMAFKVKKLSVIKIRKIFVSGKALREEVVLERVYGELAGASKVYLDCCNSEFESIKCCSSLSTSVIKRSVRDLLIYLVKRLSSLGTNTPCFGLGGMNIQGRY